MEPLVKIYCLRIMFGIVAAFICIGYLMAGGLIPENLVANPSVELGTTTPQGWFSTGNGTEWSTTYARTGARSLRINVTNSSAEWRSNVTAVQGENTYQIQGYFMGNITEDQFVFSVIWFSDSRGLNFVDENDVSVPIGNYSRWLLGGQEITAPTNAKSFEIVFKAVNGTGDMYGDDFEIRQAEFVPVFPGVPLISVKLLNNISIALMVYLVSYYAIKRIFEHKVEKPQKIFTMGIGIYFFTWLVSLVLLYTLIIVLP
jgi:hypothetical protein